MTEEERVELAGELRWSMAYLRSARQRLNAAVARLVEADEVAQAIDARRRYFELGERIEAIRQAAENGGLQI
jgi:hypothetical protein